MCVLIRMAGQYDLHRFNLTNQSASFIIVIEKRKGIKLMKSDYRVRAAKFLKEVFPYIEDCLNSNYNDVYDMISEYNRDHYRNVHLSCGAVRMALITSDYVIKWDYSAYGNELGGCVDEYNAFLAAKEAGYDYLLAETTLIEHKGYIFSIMPRISGIGRRAHRGYDINHYLTFDEFVWVMKFNHDIHAYNWGIRNGKACLIDYAMTDEVCER